MGVAAQVAARRLRRYGQVLWPSRASGEQPSGLPQVELFLGGTWVDVTAAGLVRYQEGIRITRGQPDENQKTNPSTASFRLENLDGRFNPDLATGPYYGTFERNTPCRISVQSGNIKSYRFWGEVSAWPLNWDPTGNDSWVDVQAGGILRRLGTGTAPLRSAPFIYWQNPTNVRPAVVYWPMEDGNNATQFASGISGGRPMSITGSPNLASVTSITPSAALPSFASGSSALGIVPSYTPGAQSSSGVTCYVAVPSGGETNGTVVMSFATSGSLTMELYYTTASGGQLGLRGRDSSGAIALDTGASGISVTGVPVVVGCDFEQFDATNVLLSLTVQPVTVLNGSSTVQVAAATYTMGRLTSVKVNPAGALTGTAIGHIAVSNNAVLSSVGAFNDYQGNISENAAQRFQRLCGLVGVTSHIVFTNQIQTGPKMGPQHPGAILDLLQECVDVDGGIMFELTDQLGLGYRLRDTIENQTPGLAIDYSQAQLVDVPKPVKDDSFTRNDITVTRLNGSFTRATQTSGPLNVSNAPAGVGPYATALTVNCYQDAQTADIAGWRVHLGTVPDARYPTVGLQLARAEITGSTTLRQQILALMPGDRITMANMPGAWMPPDTVSALIYGYNEQFDQFLHKISWNTAPESGYHVAVLDDPVLGRLDTDGSTLAQSYGPTDGTLLVSTTNPNSPLWTTNAGDFPFDIWVAGERMTVTNITGSSSPQTFTVTRSVNGVVKPQPATASVALYQPMILTVA